MKFPELFIIGKCVKIRFKNKGSPCYFLSSRGQNIKNITNFKQKRLFLFEFLVSFFMAFLAKKLNYTVTIWFDCVWLIFLNKMIVVILQLLGNRSFFIVIYSLPVTKNHRNIPWTCLVHEFSFTNIFKRYYSRLQTSYIK